jgi:cytochrome P450
VIKVGSNEIAFESWTAMTLARPDRPGRPAQTAQPGRPATEVLFDPSTYVDGVPFRELAKLRDQSPVVWVAEAPVLGWPEGPGFWLVLRHADVESVLARPPQFSSSLGATQIRDPATPQALDYVRQMMLNMDPPDHSRLRRLLGRSFTPRAVGRLEERIRDHARTICDRVFTGQRGECDFAKDAAADLPLLTLADVLGVPHQDRWLLFDWSNRVIGYQDPDYASSAEFDPAAGTAMARQALELRPPPDAEGRMPDPRTREGMPDLYAYAHLLAEEKRRHPGDDVMSILLAQVDDDGGQVSVAEFENMFWLFAVAGNETLRNGLPGACIALLEHPSAQEELRADPALMPAAAEEMLRWWTPVMTFRRTATSDCQLGGQHISGGDKVVVSFISANRDEAVFTDPDRFDIGRHPNPHLVFGHGPHFCLGAHLARIQVRALFEEVLARTSSLSYAGQPSYLRSNFQRGVKRLPVSWTARS